MRDRAAPRTGSTPAAAAHAELHDVAESRSPSRPHRRAESHGAGARRAVAHDNDVDARVSRDVSARDPPRRRRGDVRTIIGRVADATEQEFVAARRDARARSARTCARSPSARSRRTPSTSIATTSSSPSASSPRWAKLGYFGLSIPEKYGGHELGNLAMILTTEELSRASLAAAGLADHAARDPREGAARRRHRGAEADTGCRKLASGEVMVGDLGDRAERRLRRRVGELCEAEQASTGGWLDHRREGVVHVRRARRRDRAARAHRRRSAKARKGLTLFIVDKPRFDGHEFDGDAAERRHAHRQGRSHAGLSRHALVHARVRSLVRPRRDSSSAARPGSAAASRCRWRASRPAGCRPVVGPAA